MNRKLRIIRPVFVLSMLTLTFFASSSDAVWRESTERFWAWTYGTGVPAYSPDYDCVCKVGPCPAAYEIVGERRRHCDGTVTTWGYVDHPCADRVLSLGALCPL